jgi:hypothetical protein
MMVDELAAQILQNVVADDLYAGGYRSLIALARDRSRGWKKARAREIAPSVYWNAPLVHAFLECEKCPLISHSIGVIFHAPAGQVIESIELLEKRFKIRLTLVGVH